MRMFDVARCSSPARVSWYGRRRPDDALFAAPRPRRLFPPVPRIIAFSISSVVVFFGFFYGFWFFFFFSRPAFLRCYVLFVDVRGMSRATLDAVWFSRLWRRALALLSMVVSGLGRSLQPTSRAVDPDFEQPLMDPTFTHTIVGAAGSGGGGKTATVEDMGRGRGGGKGHGRGGIWGFKDG